MKSLNPPITDWQDLRVWLIGASSGIGHALANALQHRGSRLALSARNREPLNRVATDHDLVVPIDVTDHDSIGGGWAAIEHRWGGIDLLIYCAGDYSPMRSWEVDALRAEQLLSVNLGGAYRVIESVLPFFLSRNSGVICLVSSVAGYTGLPKALAYGPSKAALINLAQILHTELTPKGVGVSLVNPGFVETRLTEQNDFEMPALITSEQAASEILEGLERGKFEIHFPKRFSCFMKLLARLPDRLRFALLRRAAQ